MSWNESSTSPLFGAQTAIYIKPEQAAAQAVNRPLHIPLEVLKKMFEGKQTLFLSSGTCDSPVAVLHYLNAEFMRHNIVVPRPDIVILSRAPT